MEDENFEIALESFLENSGIMIEGTIDEKFRTVQANGVLGIEFALYIFRTLEVIEDELRKPNPSSDKIFQFLNAHLRSYRP